VVAVFGFDIGGANTKAVYIKTCSGHISEFQTALEYFPFWKRNKAQLSTMLTNLASKLAGSIKLDAVAITMTAELSDIFATKREGVNYILDCISQVFTNTPLWVLDVDASLRSVGAAKKEPLKVASANWAATGWMIAHYLSNCVIVDVGSTSTSIIPIHNGRVSAKGKNDLEKLLTGELVYTGSLRTNIAATVQSIPFRGGYIRVSSELFAQTGDIHLILDHITESEYTSDTADGKGKSRFEALSRLAHIVCADTEMLTEQELITIAQYIYEKQTDQIAEAINQVYTNIGPHAKATFPAVVAGLGKDFLSRKSAEKANIKSIIDENTLLPKQAALVSPAAGVALMAADKQEPEGLKWIA